MGSTIKGTKRKKWKKESRRKRRKLQTAPSGLLPHLWCRRLWVLSDTDHHSARCEVISFHKETPSCLPVNCTSWGSQFENVSFTQWLMFELLYEPDTLCKADSKHVSRFRTCHCRQSGLMMKIIRSVIQFFTFPQQYKLR